jgi:PAS domain S-box-containing protein
VFDQQAYNRSLIEASADALFAVAPDGVITDVNEEASRLTGYSRKHLVNSRFSEHFTDPDVASEGISQSFAEGRVIAYELVLVTRSGRRVPVSFNAGVFSDSAGVPLGILAAARDATAQKQLEQQLRESEVYSRSIIEANIDALMTTDPIGIITDVNQQMEELTGSTRSQLIGSRFREYFTEPELADEGIRRTLREGRVTNYELTAVNRDGVETVVSYNAATRFDRDGRLQGVVAAARDVTERKRFEDALRETNIELESANRSKDRFLASMSHELRTPLNSIIGFAGTLLMGIGGDLSEDQRHHVGIIQSNGRHLLSIINDLLDLAKIEAGTVELDVQEVVCQEVLAEVAEALRPEVERKELGMTVQAPKTPVLVKASRRELSQILLNLAGNAVKFTDRGSVGVAVQRRRKGGVGRVVFSVTDTGPGIRQEDADRLFAPFEQISSSPTRRYDGTGLGLYISRKLAHMLGGEITFSSTPGEGAVFNLEIPD